MNKRLPDSEFEIMDIIWEYNSEVTTADIMNKIKNKNSKVPTIISYLKRLESKGFVSSIKKGKERYYSSIIKRDAYIEFETALFVKQYHKNSLLSLVKSLVDTDTVDYKEITELQAELNKLKAQNKV